MINVIKREAMGRSERGWLHSQFHFSFAEYYNPDNIRFGALRVVNGVFHEDLSAGADLFDLLRPTVARGKPCRHNNQSCGHKCAPFVASKRM